MNLPLNFEPTVDELLGSKLPENLPPVQKHGPRKPRTVNALGATKNQLTYQERKRIEYTFNRKTKELFEREGYCYVKCEVYNHGADQTQDFLGCFDSMAFGEGLGTVGIQITSKDGMNDRVRRMCDQPEFRHWLAAGNSALVIGWEKQNDLYVHTRYPVTEATIALRDSRRRKI